MKLEDLCAVLDRTGFPDAGAREHPERGAVLSARSAVTRAVRDDEFLTDCLARQLDSLEQPRPRSGLVPFYTQPNSGIRFAFGFWPPGRNVGAHEHTAWTITAVCRNRLLVQTFDRDDSRRRRELVPKNLFEAPEGRVGFIYEPCIHDPRNPTARWSLSLHVTSPRDGESFDEDSCLPLLNQRNAQPRSSEPYAWVQFARHQRALVHQTARFLASTKASATANLLARCRRMGSAGTRRYIDDVTGPTSNGQNRSDTMLISHPALTLSCRDVADGVALGVETSRGWIEQLRVSRFARAAVTFCATRSEFGVDEIPGSLTVQERFAIADALADTGTFRWEAGR